MSYAGNQPITSNSIPDGSITPAMLSIGGAKGGGSDSIFHLNNQTVTTNYTLLGAYNAMSAGPITIAAGVTVTIDPNAVWTIV